MTDRPRAAVLLDLDGTLVDSVYHHVMAWDAALRDHGMPVPFWRIHSGIGMGSSRLIPWLLGGHVDEAESIAEHHKAGFIKRGHLLRAADGARALIEDLRVREVPFQVATSAEPEHREILLQALGEGDVPFTDAESVPSSKPAPDLLLSACDDLGADPSASVLIGDSPWDGEAARRVGMRCIGVRVGGFSTKVLLRGGCEDVVDSPKQLVGRL